jgi:UDP-glucuronate decarboxylase
MVAARRRAFCHVSDTVRGLLALMEHGQDLGPINLGNPHEVSMAELAREVLRLTGSSAGVRMPGREDDPRCRQPDITRARQSLGWQPTVSLQDGLADTIAWFRTQGCEA